MQWMPKISIHTDVATINRTANPRCRCKLGRIKLINRGQKYITTANSVAYIQHINAYSRTEAILLKICTKIKIRYTK